MADDCDFSESVLHSIAAPGKLETKAGKYMIFLEKPRWKKAFAQTGIQAETLKLCLLMIKHYASAYLSNIPAAIYMHNPPKADL